MNELFRTNEVVIAEKPWHRLAIRLHLEGWTNQDIGTELRQPIADVCAVITSEKGRKEIGKAIEEDGKRVEKVLEAAGLDSIYRLIMLRDNASSDTVKYQAAKTLLEHGYGKAINRVKQIVDDTNQDPAEEAERLKEELGLTKVG